MATTVPDIVFTLKAGRKGMCGEKEGGNHICPFFRKEKLSLEPHRRLLLMPHWPGHVHMAALIVREAERK